jgi:phenylalanyl-tRNA synthetase beta chain
MKVSLSWLQNYMIVKMDVAALADALTMAGLEVETISDRYDYLEDIVVGLITEVRCHPQADRLKIVTVDIADKTISVVCGAPNIEKGKLGACALPGARFPDGTVLKKSMLRGEASEGMLCSAKELGLGDDARGIMELEGNLPIGVSLKRALNVSDPVLEIDLTPNRPDCLSIIGLAREIAAIEKTQINYPATGHKTPVATDQHIAKLSSVSVQEPELCPRYAARLIVDIAVGESPFWLKDRLVSVGLKPINNVVDITNFVMLETGQPLHAFDFDRLAENRIVVRAARANEIFVTLDTKERTLSEGMLLICDGEKPVALAGVMGGLNSEIELTTTRVLLESAYFDPISIRKTAKQLGLNTDASHRFERGVDPHKTVAALNRAALLIAQTSGGKLVDGVLDEHLKPAPEKTVNLSVSRLNEILGTNLEAHTVRGLLESIEFEVKHLDADILLVTPPSFRVDIERFEDLIEEIARLWGYNKIRTTYPLIPAKSRHPSTLLGLKQRVQDLACALGFFEAITYSFIAQSSFDRLHLKPDDPRRRAVPILNPLSEEQAVLRTSLIPGPVGDH